MTEIVSRQEAIERRKLFDDRLTLAEAGLQHPAIDRADAPPLLCQMLRQASRHRGAVEDLAPQQHAAQPLNMVRGFAIDTRTLPAGIGVNHSPQGGTVAGGELGRKEVAIRFETGVQLILDHPRLDPYPSLLRIDLQNALHMTRHVHHYPSVQRLTIGAGSTAARRKIE